MEPNARISDLVRRYFATYETKDREALEGLLCDDFTFHSPHDPQLDRAGYFERCWPNSASQRAIRIEKIFDQGDQAFVRYACETTAGVTFRNTELITVLGDKIKDVEVYYGSLPEPS